MSTTPTVGIPVQRWSAKHYAVLVGLMFALLAGAFGVYALTSSEQSATTPSTVQIENVRAGNGGCTGQLIMKGGPLEGDTYNDSCGTSGGRDVPGGLRAH